MNELKNITICHKCQKLHKKAVLFPKEEARCSKCGALLYKSSIGLEYKLFSFSLTALILFAISMIYPIIEINLAGNESFLNIPQTIYVLFENGYLLVSFFSFMVLIVFPFLVMFLLFNFSLFVILKKNKKAVKSILKIIEVLNHWSMLDIFLVSVLVAMVKIFDYALIEFDIAFFSLVGFIVVEVYMTRNIYIETLWDMWEDRFE